MPSRRPTPTTPEGGDQRQGERIAKLLARAGVASRREVERMIADGRVTREGVLVDTPATVLSSLHGVAVDGKPVAAPPPARLFAFHKPAGLLVTERDPAGRPTIYDRLPAGLPRVVPVGRLDLTTEGLLLLTTDGGLKRQLELPATGVERTYRARAYGPVSQAQLEELIDGVEIDGVRYGSIDANLERRTGANTWIEMTLTEGKNREVRRVLEHLGLQVGRLIRTRYGPFVLGDMPPGAVGEIRQHDLVAFRQSLKGKTGGDKDMRVMATPLPEPAAQPAAPSRDQPARIDAGGRHGDGTPRKAGTESARPARAERPPRRDDSDPAPARSEVRRGRATAAPETGERPRRARGGPRPDAPPERIESRRPGRGVGASAPRSDRSRQAEREGFQRGDVARAGPSSKPRRTGESHGGKPKRAGESSADRAGNPRSPTADKPRRTSDAPRDRTGKPRPPTGTKPRAPSTGGPRPGPGRPGGPTSRGRR